MAFGMKTRAHTGQNSRRPRVLLVDDEVRMHLSLETALEEQCHFTAVENIAEARKALRRNPVDVLLLDIGLKGESGVDFLPEMAARHPGVYVVMLTGHHDPHVIMECSRKGASGYILKPFKPEKLFDAFADALRMQESRVADRRRFLEADKMFRRYGFIGLAPPMQRVCAQIDCIAASGANVLILGETGTGKELVARAVWHGHPAHGLHPEASQNCGAGILFTRRLCGGPAKTHGLSAKSGSAVCGEAHAASPPFIRVNCGRLSPSLAASELFGHKRGSFTGAENDTAGFFQQANGGTLFLDEIEALPLAVQAMLLRALDSGEAPRVGGGETRMVNVRVIAATNQDLWALVEKGTFREDLFHRLAVVTITVPPLRDRLDDVPLLVRHLVRQECKLLKRPVSRISPDALEYLQQPRAWRGNVRRLRNVVRKALVFQQEATLTAADFRKYIEEPADAAPAAGAVQPQERLFDHLETGDVNMTALERVKLAAHHRASKSVDRQFLECVFTRHEGTPAVIAQKIGITRSALYKMMQRVDFDWKQFRAASGEAGEKD